MKICGLRCKLCPLDGKRCDFECGENKDGSPRQILQEYMRILDDIFEENCIQVPLSFYPGEDSVEFDWDDLPD